MSRIAHALRIAQGETPDLMFRPRDGAEDGKRAWKKGPSQEGVDGRRPGAENGALPLPEPDRSPGSPAAFADWPAVRVCPLPLEVSDSAPLLSSRKEELFAAEQYRMVRTRILQHPSKPCVMVISSPGIGDGKTVTAVNLAAAFAMKSEEQVLLMDADLRRSTIHSRLRVPEAPGLAEVLSGACEPQDAIFRVEQIPGLCVLPAGKSGCIPTELLGSSRWLALMQTLRQRFQRVFVDSPPVEAVADYDLIAAVCDGVILIVRPDRTNRSLCLRALEKTHANCLGVLINATHERGLSTRYLNQYYSWRKNGKGK